VNAADEKAGWCNNCRAGSHRMCASLRCDCKQGQHSSRPSRSDGPPIGREARPLRPVKDEAPGDDVRRRARESAKQALGTAADKPVFRLEKKSPPEPPRKLGLSDHLVPLLAEIPADDADWYSVAECPTSRGAAVMATRCRKLGIPGWEWKAADGEVFVRRSA
jgi:hypothetical protein